MKGKIFGIPLVVILLVLFIAGAINVPLFALHGVTVEKLDRNELLLRELNLKLDALETPESTETSEVDEVVIPPTPVVEEVEVINEE